MHASSCTNFLRTIHIHNCVHVHSVLQLQDGNTPYSLALSGGNMGTANYVMTYASKSPQRDSGEPVRIFNMQVCWQLLAVNSCCTVGAIQGVYI